MSYVRKTWQVEGMHCVHCEAAVAGAVRKLEGLKDVRVSFRRGTLTALWDADALPLERISARIADAGYSLVAERKRLSLWKDALQLVLLLLALGAIYWLMTRTVVADWMSAFPVARAGMGLGMLLALGAMTSLHCVAMCGGINIAQSASAAQKGRRPARANLMYNLGRVISYTVIGGVVGALGMSMLVSGLALAGVGVAAAPMGEDGYAVVRDGVQYVYSEVDYGSYPAITVQAGIPVRWTIYADESKLTGCNNEIIVPAYNLDIPLEAGENIVEFTPAQTGVVPYTCWMGMIRSSIYVVDELNDAEPVEEASPAPAYVPACCM